MDPRPKGARGAAAHRRSILGQRTAGPAVFRFGGPSIPHRAWIPGLLIITLLFSWELSAGVRAFALSPEEVLVVVNTRVRAGVELAGTYMRLRGVPADNLVQVAVTDAETVTRRVYDADIALPVRRVLADRGGQPPIRCLLLMYGMPLRVSAPEVAPQEKALIAQLKRVREEARREREALAPEATGEKERLAKVIADQTAEILRREKADHSAAVDSELALVAAGEYPLAGWVDNPLFIGRRPGEASDNALRTLMVSRLDGPDAGVARRLIEASIGAEKTGLTGTAYFDARWPYPAQAPNGGYERADASIHRAAKIVAASGRMPVRLESTAKLFQPGECPDAALYCGWYSLATYVDAFTWKPGAVAYHIASSECSTLKRPGSEVWCKRMLEKGAAVVIGPVDEPYVQAFPLPEVFFGLLLEGRLTLAECYFSAIPWLSWRMVLIGDPLYRPFARPPGG